MVGEYNKGSFSAVGTPLSASLIPLRPHPFGSAKSSYNLVIKNNPL